MRTMLIALAICASAAPAAAQLTTTYTGVQREGDKEVPASAQFSVERGRVAMIMKGTHASRMLFLEKEQVLRIVSDDEKTYVDLDKNTAGRGGDPTGMLADMQKQLDQMPPQQRQMAEQMMKAAMGSAKLAPPLVYVWTKEKKTIAGYECTRVDGMRGDARVTEYCGTTSDDFKMSEAERKTMLEMQGYLRNFMIMVHADDDATRAFQWDTSVDGYPVLTRCYTGGKMTLDLQLQSVNRNPLPNDLFALPRGYRKLDMSGRPGS